MQQQISRQHPPQALPQSSESTATPQSPHGTQTVQYKTVEEDGRVVRMIAFGNAMSFRISRAASGAAVGRREQWQADATLRTRSIHPLRMTPWTPVHASSSSEVQDRLSEATEALACGSARGLNAPV